ncbi:hypothetical protein [Roseobacter sp.]
MLDIRLMIMRDRKATKDFLNKAVERLQLLRPVSICAKKART